MTQKSAFVLTSWDDGDGKTMKLARLLEKYGLRGTFFVPVCKIGKSIQADDVKWLADFYEVGSHTVTHSILTKLDRQSLDYEVRKSKHLLEKLTERRVVSFAYPKGCYNKEVVESVQHAGYICARTTKRFSIEYPNDWYRIKTTVHASAQTIHPWRLSNLSLLIRFPRKMIPKRRINDWLLLGRLFFDLALKAREVFHLWGHAWEIDHESGWSKVEDFFSYISSRSNVNYVTLGEYVNKNVLQMTSIDAKR